MLTTGKNRWSIWMINVLFFQFLYKFENFQTYDQKELMWSLKILFNPFFEKISIILISTMLRKNSFSQFHTTLWPQCLWSQWVACISYHKLQLWSFQNQITVLENKAILWKHEVTGWCSSSVLKSRYSNSFSLWTLFASSRGKKGKKKKSSSIY